MSQRLCYKYDRARSRFYGGRKREASAYTWDENHEYYQVVVPMSEGEEVIYLDVSYEATFFITSMGPATPEIPVQSQPPHSPLCMLIKGKLARTCDDLSFTWRV
jgi:hypothetical protein